ncbi:hypothetical protein HN011_001913, partial [Eciton burchellii]
MDAISHIVDKIKTRNTTYLLGLFVDFSGAFDRMSWPRFFSLLRDLQIPPHVYNLLRSYFEDREGSILGPILWNMYLDNLLSLLDNEESITDFAAYADDLCILISENSRRKLEIKANSSKNNPRLVRKIQDDDVAYQATGNSIWKDTKKKTNNKAGDNHPS